MALAVALFEGKAPIEPDEHVHQHWNIGPSVLSATKAGHRTGTGISSVTGKRNIITSGISFPYGVAILAGTIAAYLI